MTLCFGLYNSIHRHIVWCALLIVYATTCTYTGQISDSLRLPTSPSNMRFWSWTVTWARVPFVKKSSLISSGSGYVPCTEGFVFRSSSSFTLILCCFTSYCAHTLCKTKYQNYRPRTVGCQSINKCVYSFPLRLTEEYLLLFKWTQLKRTICFRASNHISNPSNLFLELGRTVPSFLNQVSMTHIGTAWIGPQLQSLFSGFWPSWGLI